MAKRLHGKNALIKNGAATIGGTNDWTITIADGLVEIPEHQDEWMHRLAGIKDWTATIVANFDPTAAQQTPMMQMILGAPATATFNFYVNATSYLGGPGYLSFDMGAPAEDKEGITFSISGDGTLAYNVS